MTTSTGITPFLTGDDGQPLYWPNDSSDSTSVTPTEITVALATSNYSADLNYLSFSQSLPTQYVPLLQAAENIWELIANVTFTTVPDTAETGTGTTGDHVPDIRVGLAMLHSSTMNFLGQTIYSSDGQDHFRPDTLLAVEDPSETAVTALQDGDYRYTGTQETVFQDFLHQLGYAIGLSDNPNDPSSIMYGTFSSQNVLPDSQDIAAIQQLYGAPTQQLSFTQSELTVLHNLVPQIFTTT